MEILPSPGLTGASPMEQVPVGTGPYRDSVAAFTAPGSEPGVDIGPALAADPPGPMRLGYPPARQVHPAEGQMTTPLEQPVEKSPGFGVDEPAGLVQQTPVRPLGQPEPDPRWPDWTTL